MVYVMDAPDHWRTRGDSRRETANEIRMIHPGMNNTWRFAIQIGGKAGGAPWVGDSWLHAHRDDRDIQLL